MSDITLENIDGRLKKLEDHVNSNQTKKAFNLLRHYTKCFEINKKLEKFLKRDKNIYVQNNERLGSIPIIFHQPDNILKTEKVLVPNTSLPFNLNKFVSSAMIEESSSLTNFLDSGILTLVSEEYAEQRLKDPKNREKLKKFFIDYL